MADIANIDLILEKSSDGHTYEETESTQAFNSKFREQKVRILFILWASH